VLLRRAPVLILDEAVSDLDAEAERDRHQALRKVAPGTTTILIAHRPSTMRLADRIIVLDHGRVAETGTNNSPAPARCSPSSSRPPPGRMK